MNELAKEGPGRPLPKLDVGIVVVELRKMRKKYHELAKAQEAFRAAVLHQKPGAYESYKVVQVREVEVKAHVRRSHKRILIAK